MKPEHTIGATIDTNHEARANNAHIHQHQDSNPAAQRRTGENSKKTDYEITRERDHKVATKAIETDSKTTNHDNNKIDHTTTSETVIGNLITTHNIREDRTINTTGQAEEHLSQTTTRGSLITIGLESPEAK